MDVGWFWLTMGGAVIVGALSGALAALVLWVVIVPIVDRVRGYPRGKPYGGDWTDWIDRLRSRIGRHDNLG